VPTLPPRKLSSPLRQLLLSPSSHPHLLSREFGDTETARSVLTRLIGLLEVLDADDEPEAADVTRPKPTKRARSKPAE